MLLMAAGKLVIDWTQMPTYNTIMSVAAGAGLISIVYFAREMIRGGLEARVACLDPRVCPRELIGARFDEALLDRLPEAVDPCGERGEFHTCVTAGPMFSSAIPVECGEVVERDGFVFGDLR